MIPLAQLRPNPFQPRRAFDPEKLEELAASIREVGLLAPILVRPVDGGYELVHGERRWRACAMLGMTEIQAEVRELTDEQAFLAAFTENLQRENLSPIEEAEALRYMVDKLGYTQHRAAESIGKSQQFVADRLTLLKLPEPVQDMVTARAVSPSVGRMLARLDDSDRAEQLAMEVAEGRLTVRGLGDKIAGREPYEKAEYGNEDLKTLSPQELAARGIRLRREWVQTANALAAKQGLRFCHPHPPFLDGHPAPEFHVGDFLIEVEKRTGSWEWTCDGWAVVLWVLALGAALRLKDSTRTTYLADALELCPEGEGKHTAVKALRTMRWLKGSTVAYEPPWLTADPDEWTLMDWIHALVAGASEMHRHGGLDELPYQGFINSLPVDVRYDPLALTSFVMWDALQAIGKQEAPA